MYTFVLLSLSVTFISNLFNPYASSFVPIPVIVELDAEAVAEIVVELLLIVAVYDVVFGLNVGDKVPFDSDRLLNTLSITFTVTQHWNLNLQGY